MPDGNVPSLAASNYLEEDELPPVSYEDAASEGPHTDQLYSMAPSAAGGGGVQSSGGNETEQLHQDIAQGEAQKKALEAHYNNEVAEYNRIEQAAMSAYQRQLGEWEKEPADSRGLAPSPPIPGPKPQPPPELDTINKGIEGLQGTLNPPKAKMSFLPRRSK